MSTRHRSAFSIAVLPFTDLSPSAGHAYLSDGITMEVIHALSRYRELQVTSRLSSSHFNLQKMDVASIGDRLNVAFLLDGQTRMERDTVQVTVQLIGTDGGTIVWTSRWERSLKDVFDLRKGIADPIAARIHSDIGPVPETEGDRVADPRAIEAYMKGQYLLNQLDSGQWKQMIAHFEEALKRDPSFSKPLVALCHSYSWLASIGTIDPATARSRMDEWIDSLYSKGKPIAEVYLLLAEKDFWIDWRPSRALERIRQSLDLRFSHSSALVMQGLILASLGSTEEALDSFFRAERIDPIGENVKYCIGLVYNYLGDSEMALDSVRESLERSPYWLAPYFTMVEVLCSLGRAREVHRFIDEKQHIPGFREMIPVFEGMAFAYEGRIKKALDRVKKIRGVLNGEANPPPLYYNLALIYLQLGQTKAALKWIQKGLASRSTPFLFIQIDHRWDPFRNDPVFREMVKSSGLGSGISLPSEEVRKYRKSTLSESLAGSIRDSLEKAMKEDRCYLEPRLTLSDLAERCQVSVNHLSQYLNASLGKNFYDYINRYRLDHFMKIAGEREYQNLSILGLAYESGFNSKTTFNTFCRKETGMPPRELIRKKNG